jgi:hypothetical protein
MYATNSCSKCFAVRLKITSLQNQHVPITNREVTISLFMTYYGKNVITNLGEVHCNQIKASQHLMQSSITAESPTAQPTLQSTQVEDYQ